MPRRQTKRETSSRLETGKRRLALDHVPALAGALGVSTDDLHGPAPHKNPESTASHAAPTA